MTVPSVRLGQRRGVSTHPRRLSIRNLFLLVIGFAIVVTFWLLKSAPHDTPSSTTSHAVIPYKKATHIYPQTPGISKVPPLPPLNIKERPVTVAYAISLIKCGDFQSSAEGMNDAAIILRHSIHQTSIRNPDSGSKYDYKMYAIVHSQAEQCSQPLRDAGFELVIRSPPLTKEEIQGDFLRKRIHREWCCGHDEFIKLYAYQFQEPIVVHLDVDFGMHRPMDDVFDAMLGIGSARDGIPLERPNDVWPSTPVEAFMTRDWPQVIPGRKPGYQAGFIVLRPSQAVFDEIVEVIKEGNYVDGFQRENGWGGLGYGGYVGAMAMQGLLAYYYDIYRPFAWMELNQCRYVVQRIFVEMKVHIIFFSPTVHVHRFNHIGMDVLYRNAPGFKPSHPKRGKCRNDLDYCEDCMTTNVSDIYNIHFCMCRKPWSCLARGSKGAKGHDTLPEDQVNYEHCMELHTLWHNHRADLETKLQALTNDSTIAQGQAGNYKKETFQGHCVEDGKYLALSGKPETMKRIPELYNKQ